MPPRSMMDGSMPPDDLLRLLGDHSIEFGVCTSRALYRMDVHPCLRGVGQFRERSFSDVMYVQRVRVNEFGASVLTAAEHRPQ